MNKKFTPTITRTKKGDIFVYKYINNNKTITSPDVLDNIKKLIIPPAWENVLIDLESNKIIVTGIDANGKKQYIYSKEHINEVSNIKFCKLIKLGAKIEKLKKDLNKLLSVDKITKNTLIAMIIKIIMKCS